MVAPRGRGRGGARLFPGRSRGRRPLLALPPRRRRRPGDRRPQLVSARGVRVSTVSMIAIASALPYIADCSRGCRVKHGVAQMDPKIATLQERMANGGDWMAFHDEIVRLHNDARTQEEYITLLEAH